jgi:hypothetical protein
VHQEVQEKPKNHVIISGTGRTGSTFIVKILTKLGLETGFSPENLEENIFPECQAGLEMDIRMPDAPYIIKSPWICDYIDELLDNKNIHIEFAIIPIRDIRDVAQSRISVSNNRDIEKYKNPSDAPGGLWGTENPKRQEYILYQKLMKLILSLSAKNIPMIFIHFPKLTQDSIYLYSKLKPILKDIEYLEFENVFQNTVNLEFVDSFLRS